MTVKNPNPGLRTSLVVAMAADRQAEHDNLQSRLTMPAHVRAKLRRKYKFHLAHGSWITCPVAKCPDCVCYLFDGDLGTRAAYMIKEHAFFALDRDPNDPHWLFVSAYQTGAV
jgi:hypothetical protein